MRSSAETKIKLIVPGMGSDHCAGIVRTSLARLHGIQHIQTSLASHRVYVSVDQDGPSMELIKQAVERAGYDVAQITNLANDDHSQDHAIEEAFLKLAGKRLLIAGLPTTVIMLMMMPHMFWRPIEGYLMICLLYTSPSPRDRQKSRMPSSA